MPNRRTWGAENDHWPCVDGLEPGFDDVMAHFHSADLDHERPAAAIDAWSPIPQGFTLEGVDKLWLAEESGGVVRYYLLSLFEESAAYPGEVWLWRGAAGHAHTSRALSRTVARDSAKYLRLDPCRAFLHAPFASHTGDSGPLPGLTLASGYNCGVSMPAKGILNVTAAPGAGQGRMQPVGESGVFSVNGVNLNRSVRVDVAGRAYVNKTTGALAVARAPAGNGFNVSDMFINGKESC